MKKIIFAAIAAIVCLAACKQSALSFEGKVVDATMNTLVIANDGGEITINISDADPTKVEGVLLGDIVKVTYNQVPAGGENFINVVESLVVTAIVHAPEYLSTMESMYGQSGRGSGSLDGILYTVPAAFASEDFSGGFPVVNVRAAIGADLSCFTTAYRAESDVIQARLEEITPEMSSERFEEVKGEAQAEVDAVTEVLDESKQAVKDAKKQVEDGEKQLRGYLEYFGLEVGYMLSFNFNRRKEPGLKRVEVGDKVLWEETV